MKIVFVCGCLEPRKDGVGDYTIRLGSELLRLGHVVGLISLSDKFIQGVQVNDQFSEAGILHMLRVPSAEKWSIRRKVVKSWISKFQPDWISLQYVPFSFQSKGLLFRFVLELPFIFGVGPIQVMIHELCVGLSASASLKFKVWGTVQKLSFLLLLVLIRPKIIHTHTPIYAKQLNKRVWRPLLLPLFSNIERKVRKTSAPQGMGSVSAPVKAIEIVLFGHQNAEARVETFLSDLSTFSKRFQLDVRIKALGRCGMQIDRWRICSASNNIPFVELGELTPEQISEALIAATFGVTTTAFPIVTKSGTIAAMLDHELPVLCIAAVWDGSEHLDGQSPIAGVAYYVDGAFGQFYNQMPVPMSSVSCNMVALQFVSNLITASA